MPSINIARCETISVDGDPSAILRGPASVASTAACSRLAISPGRPDRRGRATRSLLASAIQAVASTEGSCASSAARQQTKWTDPTLAGGQDPASRLRLPNALRGRPAILQRHVSIELGVAGAIHLTHAAVADLGGDRVASNALLQSHQLTPETGGALPRSVARA